MALLPSACCLILAASEMRNLIKRKRDPAPAPGAPITFINSASSSPPPPKPNQNIDPDKTATVMMINARGTTGDDARAGPSTGADHDENDPYNDDDDEQDLDRRVRRLTVQLKDLRKRQPSVTVQTPIKIKKFSGQDSTDVCEWTEDFITSVAVNDWPPPQAFLQLKAHLEGRALSWIRAYMQRSGLPETTDELKAALEELRAQFSDARPMLMNLSRIRQLRQKEDDSVQDYYFAMVNLLGKAGIALDSVQAIDYIISGLKPSLAQKVYADADTYPNCEALYKKLKILDEAENHRKVRDDDVFLSDPSRPGPAGPSQDRRVRFSDAPPANPDSGGNAQERTQGPRQYNQRGRGRFNHTRGGPRPAYRPNNYQRPRDGNNRNDTEPRPPQTNACWNCGDAGHWSFQCPQGHVGAGRQGNADRGPFIRRSGPLFRNRTRWSAPQQDRPSYTSN